MNTDGAAYIEEIAQAVIDGAIKQIETGRKAMGPRPPFTTPMTRAQKLELWLTAELRGPAGWLEFLRARATEGLSPERSLSELARFYAWGAQEMLRQGATPLQDIPTGVAEETEYAA